MTCTVLSNQMILMDGYDLTGHMNSVAIEYGSEMKEATVFRQSTRSQIGGLFTTQLQAGGFYDAVPQDAPVFSAIGTEVPITVGAGLTPGDVAYFFSASAGEYQQGESVGEINKWTLGAGAGDNTTLVRGVVEHNALDTAATSALIASLGQQLGAVGGAEKLYVCLHVTESNGSGDQTFDIDVESDDNSGFTTPLTQGSFNQFTTSVGSQILEIAGPILDDYFRLSFTIAGSGSPSFKFNVSMGIK